jgi:DNA-binding GntR family transcriptional regulator
MDSVHELPELVRVESLADQAYRSLREGIVTGVFSAGERITERGLADRLGVSATPVREAMRRLEQERLIERVSPRVVRVVDHSAETVQELMYAEAVLRSLEARFAASRITDEALDRMEGIVRRMSDDMASVDAAEARRLARQFDIEIERAADNAVLRSMIQALSVFGHERWLRYMDTIRVDPDLRDRRLQDHAEILDALRSRDPDGVEAVFRRHVIAAADSLLHDLPDQ